MSRASSPIPVTGGVAYTPAEIDEIKKTVNTIKSGFEKHKPQISEASRLLELQECWDPTTEMQLNIAKSKFESAKQYFDMTWVEDPNSVAVYIEELQKLFEGYVNIMNRHIQRFILEAKLKIAQPVSNTTSVKSKPKKCRPLFLLKIVTQENWSEFMLELVNPKDFRQEKRRRGARKNYTVRLSAEHGYEVVPTNKSLGSRQSKFKKTLENKFDHTKHQSVTIGSHSIGNGGTGFYPAYFNQTSYPTDDVKVGVVFLPEAVSKIPFGLIGTYEGGTYARMKDFNSEAEAKRAIAEKLQMERWFTTPEELVEVEAKKESSRLNEALAYLTVKKDVIDHFAIMIFEDNKQSRLVASIRAAEFKKNFYDKNPARETREIPICFYRNIYGKSVLPERSEFEEFKQSDKMHLLERPENKAWLFVYYFLNSKMDQNFTLSIPPGFSHLLLDEKFKTSVKKILSVHCDKAMLKKFNDDLGEVDKRIITIKVETTSAAMPDGSAVGAAPVNRSVPYSGVSGAAPARFPVADAIPVNSPVIRTVGNAVSYQIYQHTISEMLRSISRKVERAVSAGLNGSSDEITMWVSAIGISNNFLKGFGELDKDNQYFKPFETEILNGILRVVKKNRGRFPLVEEKKEEFLDLFTTLNIHYEKMLGIKLSYHDMITALDDVTREWERDPEDSKKEKAARDAAEKFLVSFTSRPFENLPFSERYILKNIVNNVKNMSDKEDGRFKKNCDAFIQLFTAQKFEYYEAMGLETPKISERLVGMLTALNNAVNVCRNDSTNLAAWDNAAVAAKKFLTEFGQLAIDEQYFDASLTRILKDMVNYSTRIGSEKARYFIYVLTGNLSYFRMLKVSVPEILNVLLAMKEQVSKGDWVNAKSCANHLLRCSPQLNSTDLTPFL